MPAGDSSPTAPQTTTPSRQPGWIYTIVSRWGEFTWRWIVRVLWLLAAVLLVLAFLWSLKTDEDTDTARTEALANRTFKDVAVVSAPQNGARLPIVGALYRGGSYNVADQGRCSFVVKFDSDTPVVTFALPDGGGEIEVRDADPTRLHHVPAIAAACR